MFVEVKCVTLCRENGLGLFPDAVSDRGRKHLLELRDAAAEAGTRALMLYCVFHAGVDHVCAAGDIDSRYRATLEEVCNADVILHVRDISHPETDSQMRDVLSVLAELGIDEARQQSIIEVWNKCDLLDDETRDSLRVAARKAEAASVMVSAHTGEGLDELLAMVAARIFGPAREVAITLAPHQGADIAWLYENGTVLNRNDSDTGDMVFKVQLPQSRMDEAQRRFGRRMHILSSGDPNTLAAE